MFTWPCKTWISILLLLRVILHPDIELGQVLYEYFEIRYGMFLSIIREPLISPKQDTEVNLFFFPNKSTALHHWDTLNKLEYR